MPLFETVPLEGAQLSCLFRLVRCSLICQLALEQNRDVFLARCGCRPARRKQTVWAIMESPVSPICPALRAGPGADEAPVNALLSAAAC